MTRLTIALLAALSLAAAGAATAQETAPEPEEPAQATETETTETEPTETEPTESEPTETETTETEDPAAGEEAAVAPTSPAAPQEVLRETHGDWNIICSTDGEDCVMAQTGTDAEGREVMEVRVRRLEPRTQENVTIVAAIQIAVPIGVILPPGVSLQIDGGKKLPAAYRACNPNACLVQEPVDEGLVDLLKRGAAAVFTLVAPPTNEVPVEISLTGFTAAYNSLEP